MRGSEGRGGEEEVQASMEFSFCSCVRDPEVEKDRVEVG